MEAAIPSETEVDESESTVFAPSRTYLGPFLVVGVALV